MHIATGQICAAHAVLENGVAHKGNALLWNIVSQASFGVAGSGKHLNLVIAKGEFVTLLEVVVMVSGCGEIRK